MNCLFAVAFLAMVAVTLAGPLPETPKINEGEKKVEPVKAEDVKDTRDKRGLLLTSYATAPVAAPIAYASYSAPIAYSAGLPVSYVESYSTYVHPYTTYAVI